jgi:hypothetical protein
MWEQEVSPELERRGAGASLVTRTLKTAGLGEGHIDEMLSPYLKSLNPTIGVYAKQDGVHLRIGAKAASREEAQQLIAPLEAERREVRGRNAACDCRHLLVRYGVWRRRSGVRPNVHYRTNSGANGDRTETQCDNATNIRKCRCYVFAGLSQQLC